MTTRADLKEMGLLDFFLRVCEQEHTTLDLLLSARQTPRLARARVVVYVYLRSLGWSHPEIGLVANRDPTTVRTQILKYGTQMRKVVPIRPLASTEPE